MIVTELSRLTDGLLDETWRNRSQDTEEEASLSLVIGTVIIWHIFEELGDAACMWPDGSQRCLLPVGNERARHLLLPNEAFITFHDLLHEAQSASVLSRQEYLHVPV